MVNMDDARIASYEDNGYVFEIFVDPDIALEIKKGTKEISNNLGKLLAVDEVYKSARSGERASEKSLQTVFGTTDLLKVVKTILEKGHLDLTTEQKRKLYDEKRKEVLNYIVKNSINPITKAPHTPQRVESAFEETKITIDIQKSLESQMDKIIEKLSVFLPMEFKKFTCRVKIPVAQAGRVSGMINKFEVSERKWESDYFYFVAKVPAGEKDQFFGMISGLTKGTAQFEFE